MPDNALLELLRKARLGVCFDCSEDGTTKALDEAIAIVEKGVLLDGVSGYNHPVKKWLDSLVSGFNDPCLIIPLPEPEPEPTELHQRFAAAAIGAQQAAVVYRDEAQHASDLEAAARAIAREEARGGP